MKISKIYRDDSHLVQGLVVVIDVLRAFTTAAFAFASGAKTVILVSEIEEAKKLHAKNPEFLLMGESEGLLIEGFHFGNSPFEIASQNLRGKTLVQRTTCGTRGVINAKHAEKILVASFVVAKATLERIRALAPEHLTLMATSHHFDEDLSFADFIEASLFHSEIDSEPYLNRVIRDDPYFCREDLEAALMLDRFPFAMEVFPVEGQLHLKPVTSKGEVWVR